MSENPASQPEEKGKELKRNCKRRSRGVADDADDCDASNASTKKREINGIISSITKPSYCLQRGVDSIQQAESGENLRSLHRKRLWRLLKKLLLKQNWSEASGVLSVLLKATAKETSPIRNRSKYWATLELMRRVKGDTFNQRKIQNVYDIWMKKLGPMEKQPIRERFSVQLEFILYCLGHGNIEDAHQGALCLMQERGFESNPFANLVVGLTFYEIWYSSIPEDMQLRELSEPSSPMQSLMSAGSYMSVEKSEGHEAVEAQDRNLPMECDSSTSIGNEKGGLKVITNKSREVSMEVDYKEQKTPGSGFQAQGFYLKSAESSRHEGSLVPNHSGEAPTTSIFYTHGLPPWILPLKLPDSTEDLENFLYRHRKLLNDNYRNAVKYFRVALYSEPPMFEAFHPLIQMLLLGDQVKEALNEMENFSQYPDTALHSRLKTCLLEYFDHDNYFKLSTYFENILKKDPTCSHSLAKLLSMHQRGDYSSERLVQMIALHLDATFGDCSTWKVLASCLFKLSQCEDDEMSTCLDRREDEKQQRIVHSNRIPAIFTNSEPKNDWRLRCRWWLSRHFSQKILQSDIASGEMQLVTYKAATATHLYGREVKYVAKVTEYLEKEKNSEMLSILREHMQNSVGFYLS